MIINTSPKNYRVNAYLSEEVHSELRKLAFECGITKTRMAAEILECVLLDKSLREYIKLRYDDAPSFSKAEQKLVLLDKSSL